MHPTLLYFSIYIIFLWQITIFAEISWWNLFFSRKQHFLPFLAIFGHFYLWEGESGPNFNFFCIQLCFISLFISFFCGKSQFLLKLVDETCFFQENSIFLPFLAIFGHFYLWEGESGPNFHFFASNSASFHYLYHFSVANHNF